MADPTVTTWADGFGRWHASVMGADTEPEAKRLARRAIRAEIAARQNDPPPRLRIDLYLVRPDGLRDFVRLDQLMPFDWVSYREAL